ncbi:hypothetical protein [Phaeacidiphilus oryzae]|uniref:hypothetical protein n=1 Tax=Phaeacidiphilus oryzae TaxID=348818 RepID=UPI0005677CD2|nr:hypothetical protein [Phaeacidiphilus oryzae]
MSTADPVRELMERHHRLCVEAVDPLEIAAALEAEGLGPGAATRYRHSDVFSLAEELHARAPGEANRRGRPSGFAAVPRSASGRFLGRALGGSLAAAALCLGTAAAARGGWPPSSGRGVDALLAGLLLAAVLWSSGAVRGPWAWPAALGAAGLVAVPLSGAIVGASDLGGAGGTAARTPAAVVAATLALGVGTAGVIADWYAEVGRGHLRATGSRSGFRSRMRVVLPVAAVAQLALLGAVCLVLLVVPSLALGERAGAVAAPTAPFGGAGPPVWGGLAAAGLVMLPGAALRACGRPRIGAGALLAGALATLAAALLPALSVVLPGLPASGPAQPGGVIPAWSAAVAAARSGSAELYGCGAVAAVLLPYAWWVLHRPEAHYLPLVRTRP